MDKLNILNCIDILDIELIHFILMFTIASISIECSNESVFMALDNVIAITTFFGISVIS